VVAAALTVRDVMTPGPITVSPEDSLMEALQLMRVHKIRRVPVMVGDKLVGLVTQSDVKRAEPSTLSDTEEHFTQVMEGTSVMQIMVQNLVTTTPDTPLIEAARTLRKTKYGGLPVVEGERLVGILTDGDLVGALVKLLERES
jgi:acetoin utilization protein AcuB